MSYYVPRDPQKSGFVGNADDLMREFNAAVDALLHVDSNNIAGSTMGSATAVPPTSDRRAVSWLYDVSAAAVPKMTQAGSMTTTVDDGLWTTITDGGSDMVLSFTTHLTMRMVFGAVCNISNGAAAYPCIDLRFLVDGSRLGMVTRSTQRGAATGVMVAALRDSAVILPGSHTLRVQVRDRSDGATGATLSGLQAYTRGVVR